jgi:hypothetical protein
MWRARNLRGNCELPILVVLSILRHAGPVVAAWRRSARRLSRTSGKERLGSLLGQARPNSLQLRFDESQPADRLAQS